MFMITYVDEVRLKSYTGTNLQECLDLFLF